MSHSEVERLLFIWFSCFFFSLFLSSGGVTIEDVAAAARTEQDKCVSAIFWAFNHAGEGISQRTA